jgi:hypothetical protein
VGLLAAVLPKLMTYNADTDEDALLRKAQREEAFALRSPLAPAAEAEATA